MKVLKVIHGYPERYSAGSEVYSQTLCHELVRQGHEVVVFTRQENAYKQEYGIEWGVDTLCKEIRLCLVNMTHSRDGYRHAAVDRAFEQLLDEYQPEVLHVGHLNHLSTSIIMVAGKRNIPIVFTLHDFWLMCPRGQFLQGINSIGEDLYPVCSGQQDEKCARNCYWRYFSSQDDQEDIQFWTGWVKKRMKHIREDVLPHIDLFIAPSHYLRNRFIDDFSVDSDKIVYLDYGFRREHLKRRERKRKEDELFTFGYMGTHKQAKGIFHLLKAFREIHPLAKLKIWGSPINPFTSSLTAFVSTFNEDIQESIDWIGSYKNIQIVEDVFNQVDAIVVPSIWCENSPLVIHEALEANVPIITADFGGMKEYVHHEVNGLLFQHRDPSSLATQMKRLVEDTKLCERISQKGYLQSEDGRVPDIEKHVKKMENLYKRVRRKRFHHYADQTGPMAHHV